MRLITVIPVFILIFLFTIIIGYYVVIPRIIEKRAHDLGLMQYNSEIDGFVGKDSTVINKWDIQYLKYGEMKSFN